MNTRADDLHIDTNLFSALGHAQDDQERFMNACMQFAERNYDYVQTWFVREFQFLSDQDSNDAMHEFFVTLSFRLMGESPQAKLHEFKNAGHTGKLCFHLYLKAIARNAARDFIRKQRRLNTREVVVSQEIMEGKIISCMEQVVLGESEEMLSDIRSQAGIKDRDWNVFISSLEYSAAEVAERRGLTLTAIYAINCRVRKKLLEIQSQIQENYGSIGRLIISDADQLSCATFHPDST